MSITTSLRRRDFLVRTTVAAAGVLGATCLSTAVLADEAANTPKKKRKRKRRPRPVHKLKQTHFKKLVGEKFKVSALRHDVIVKLVAVDVNDYPSDDKRPIHIRQQAFSLLFVAIKGERLKSTIHEFEHPEFGEVDLFLHEVAADGDKKTVYYEVVFN